MAGVGPLVPHQAGALSQGDFVIIKYNVAEQLWHVRLLLSHVHQGLWVILTPDGDLYMEELSEGNRDIIGWRVFDPNGSAPYGIAPNQIYGFRNYPDAAAVQRLQDEGARHAHIERGRLGVPVAAAAGVGAGIPGPAGGAAPGVPNLAGQAAVAVGGAGPNAGAGPCAAGGGGGNAGLAAALAAPAAAGGPGISPAEDDARTLGITWDETGRRFKDFRSAASESKPVDFGDWPIGAPRTTKHVITQMLDHGGSAIAHHQAWRIACKFSAFRWPCCGARGLVQGAPHPDGLRSIGRNEPCRCRTGGSCYPAHRGEAQVQAGLGRGRRRGLALHGGCRRAEAGLSGVSEADRMDRHRDAEGSHGSEGAAQGAGERALARKSDKGDKEAK